MKKIIALAAAFLMLAVSAAQAVSISRSSSSAPARSMGMSRPAVIPQKPAAPAPSSAPAPTYRPAAEAPLQSAPSYHPAPAAAPAPVQQSSGAGNSFLAGAAGGLVGSVVGNAISGPHGGGTTVVNNGAAAAPAPVVEQHPQTGTVVAAPQAQAAQPSASTWSWLRQTLVFFMLTILVITGGWLFYRIVQHMCGNTQALKQAEEQAETTYKNMNEDLPFFPVTRFWEVQRAFAARNVLKLSMLVGPDVLDELESSLPAEPVEPKFSGVRYEILDRSDRHINVHFKAHDDLDNNPINEVWLFQKSPADGAWLLNGVNQVDE